MSGETESIFSSIPTELLGHIFQAIQRTPRSALLVCHRWNRVMWKHFTHITSTSYGLLSILQSGKVDPCRLRSLCLKQNSSYAFALPTTLNAVIELEIIEGGDAHGSKGVNALLESLPNLCKLTIPLKLVDRDIIPPLKLEFLYFVDSENLSTSSANVRPFSRCSQLRRVDGTFRPQTQLNMPISGLMHLEHINLQATTELWFPEMQRNLGHLTGNWWDLQNPAPYPNLISLALNRVLKEEVYFNAPKRLRQILFNSTIMTSSLPELAIRTWSVAALKKLLCEPLLTIDILQKAFHESFEPPSSDVNRPSQGPYFSATLDIIAKFLVDAGVDKNGVYMGGDHQPYLQHALSYEQWHVLTRAIDIGVDFDNVPADQTSTTEVTLAMFGFSRTRDMPRVMQMLKLLLASGADLSRKNIAPLSLFDLEVVQLFHNTGKVDYCARNELGDSVVTAASIYVHRGHGATARNDIDIPKEVFEWLQSHGVDISRDSGNIFPMHTSPYTLLRFIEAGADPNKIDYGGRDLIQREFWVHRPRGIQDCSYRFPKRFISGLFAAGARLDTVHPKAQNTTNATLLLRAAYATVLQALESTEVTLLPAASVKALLETLSWISIPQSIKQRFGSTLVRRGFVDRKMPMPPDNKQTIAEFFNL